MIPRNFSERFQFGTVIGMKNDSQAVELHDLPAVAAGLLSFVNENKRIGSTVIALRGDLGAGKTTLVQTLGKLLGIAEHITSPTFTIMKSYETTDSVFQRLIHMDAYRIDELSELTPLRFDELLTTPDTLFCIEWAEKIKEALPDGVIHVSLAVVSENTRTVHISRD